MACHSPFQPVLRNVLPIPLIQRSPSIQYQVDPGLGWLVFRVEHQVGEPHVFQKLRKMVKNSGRNLYLFRFVVKVTVWQRIRTDGVAMPWGHISSGAIHCLSSTIVLCLLIKGDHLDENYFVPDHSWKGFQVVVELTDEAEI